MHNMVRTKLHKHTKHHIELLIASKCSCSQYVHMGSRCCRCPLHCLLQATALHEEWNSEKAQRIQLNQRLVKQATQLADQVMLNDANQNTIRYHCTLRLCLPIPGTQAAASEPHIAIASVGCSWSGQCIIDPFQIFVLENAWFSVSTAPADLIDHLHTPCQKQLAAGHFCVGKQLTPSPGLSLGIS